MGFFNKLFGTKVSDNVNPAQPQSVDLNSALSMQLRGEVNLALDAYQKIIEQAPEDHLAIFFASAIKAGKGNTGEAAESLRLLSRRISSEAEDSISRLISLDLATLMSDDPFLNVTAVAEIFVSFGDILKQEGFVQESAVCYEIAAWLLPDHAHVLHKLGDTLHDLRIYDYAEKVLLGALKYAPYHWGALYTYAVLLQDLGRFTEAITYYEKALQLDPNHAKCQNNYGAALMATNRLEEALEHCTLAAELAPGFSFAKINIGNIYLLMHSYEAARTCFAEAISLGENLPKGYLGLGLAEEFLGSDSGRIRECYLKAIELNPSFPEAHHALGNLLARDGNLEALPHFSMAVKLNNNLMNLHRDFGTACLKMGLREEAMGHLKLALQQNPDDNNARVILSKMEEENQA